MLTGRKQGKNKMAAQQTEIPAVSRKTNAVTDPKPFKFRKSGFTKTHVKAKRKIVATHTIARFHREIRPQPPGSIRISALWPLKVKMLPKVCEINIVVYGRFLTKISILIYSQ